MKKINFHNCGLPDEVIEAACQENSLEHIKLTFEPDEGKSEIFDLEVDSSQSSECKI